MELVQGIPFNEYCDKNKLSLKERLELFVPVCNAIQHAHQKGIIHRDLKPSNVLVTLYDGKPVPKVMEFGLAKALQHQTKLTDKTMFSEFGQVVGTLQYMSPEQAEMNALDVDERTDVYSLGIMLYELLTGSTPLEEATINQYAILQLLELIKEKDPPKPSTRLSDSGDAITGVSQQRKMDPGKLQQTLRRELDWIVMKALEKDRTRRYASPRAFREDIEHYLQDEPVEARPPSIAYRVTKSVRKHRKHVRTSLFQAPSADVTMFANAWTSIVVNSHDRRQRLPLVPRYSEQDALPKQQIWVVCIAEDQGKPLLKLAPDEQLGRIMDVMVNSRGNRPRNTVRRSQQLLTGQARAKNASPLCGSVAIFVGR